MEGDVVGALVEHLFGQGCEQVFLVDNGSPDDTVQIAEAAGAVLSVSYRTEVYDEALRMSLMGSVMDHVSRTRGLSRAWWLFTDADEFTYAPNHEPIADWLERVPSDSRVVGAFVLNHYPDPEVPTPVGSHPLEFQPVAEDFTQGMCTAGHRKHPLVRWDTDGPPLRIGHGFHKIHGPGLREPTWELIQHHFPFRNPTATSERLERLLSQGGRAAAAGEASRHMQVRRASLQAVYEGRYADVEGFLSGERGVPVQDWRAILAARASERSRTQ